MHKLCMCVLQGNKCSDYAPGRAGQPQAGPQKRSPAHTTVHRSGVPFLLLHSSPKSCHSEYAGQTLHPRACRGQWALQSGSAWNMRAVTLSALHGRLITSCCLAASMHLHAQLKPQLVLPAVFMHCSCDGLLLLTQSPLVIGPVLLDHAVHLKPHMKLQCQGCNTALWSVAFEKVFSAIDAQR